MKIYEIISKPSPKKINVGNGGKITIKYGNEIPKTMNPIAKSVLTLPHLRQRAIPNKKLYNRKKMKDYD
jgi:hypothetical protein